MLSGMTKQDPGMFQGITEGFDKPDAEEMDKLREAAMYDKIVRFDGFKSRTYDLGNKNSVRAYERMMCKLMEGIQTKTRSVLFHDRKFVEEDGKNPRWIAHLEWAEFELKKEPVRPTGTNKGVSDG